MSIKTADVLDRAANIIERNGWYQGSYFDRYALDGERSPNDCPVCTLGALNVALGALNPSHDVDLNGPAEMALRRYLNLDDSDGADSLADWNDRRCRTAEQVVAALRAAAQAEREAAL